MVKTSKLQTHATKTSALPAAVGWARQRKNYSYSKAYNAGLLKFLSRSVPTKVLIVKTM